MSGALQVAGGAGIAGNVYAGAVYTNSLFYANGSAFVSGVTIGGSSGQIQYNNGGSLAGSANLVWDNTNGRLGIGNASPNFGLDIVSNVVTVGEVHLASFRPVTRGDGAVSIGYVADGTTDTYGFIRSRHSVDLGIGAGSTTHLFIKQSGNTGIGTTIPSQRLEVAGTGLATTDWRAPIFYDSDDTSYYVNPAGTSILNNARANNFHDSTGTYNVNLGSPSEGRGLVAGYSGGWYAGIGYNVRHSGSTGVMYAPSADTALYLNFGNTNRFNFWFNNSGAAGRSISWTELGFLDNSGIMQVTGSHRAPIFYDSNDTTYYADLNASTSINAAGTIKATAGRIALRDDSIENWATASDSAGIVVNYYGYSSGTSYYRDFTVYDGKGGLRFKTYGSGNYSYASGSMRAPIFYDSDDTNYYLDPNGTSRLYNVFVANQLRSPNFYDTGANFIFQPGTTSGTTRHLNLANTTGDPASVSNGDAVGITWGQRTDSNPYYLIYPYYYANGYSSHTRLRLAWHTGIEIGAASGYGGTRFFDNSPFTGSEIFSVGKGDNHVRVINNLYAPFIYDSSNTAYYIDPNNISNLYDVRSYSYQGNGNVGGTGSASWHPSGIYSAGYNWLYGGINCGGSSITNISAVYSYTFYDATNTAYYIDPASTSNFSALNVGGSAVLTAGNYTSYISSGSEPTFSAFDGLPIGTS